MANKKFGIIAVSLMAMIVAVAVNNVTSANADKYEDVTQNNKLTTLAEEFNANSETEETGTNDNTQEYIDPATCSHTARRVAIEKKAVTCTKNGMMEYYCSDCNKLMSKEVIPAIGHAYDENEQCTNCGEYDKPTLWAEYEVDGVLYKITNPLSNGWGKVTLKEQINKEVQKADIAKTVTINGYNYKISKIGDEAFEDCEKLTKVEIGKEVKTIGKAAFKNCKKLKTVKMDNGVEEIEKSAFENCKNLKSLEIAKSVKIIGDQAFKDCTDLKKVEIGKGVKKISKEAFYNCEDLKEVEIGKSVERIEKEAFAKCKKLKEVKVISTVLTRIDQNAFEGISAEAVFVLDKDNFDTIKAVFTPNTGVELTMEFQAKKSVWDYFGQNDEEAETEIIESEEYTDEYTEDYTEEYTDNYEVQEYTMQ